MINSRNEWDPLEEIVVGTALHANWPTTDPVFASEAEKTTWKETPLPSGPVPQWIVDQTNEDLEQLVEVCVRYGAVVRRPQPMNWVQRQGMYGYCPRDRLLIAGDTAVDVSMMYPCRNQEIGALDNILYEARVLRMPKNKGLTLDAANICRLGDTWLFLESASGNRAAYDWLCEQFPNIKIELCNFYAGVHIDSTICPVREGLVVLNADRINDTNVPSVFKSWDKIWSPPMVDIGYHKVLRSSLWIGINLLSVDENTVIVDNSQKELIKELNKYKTFIVENIKEKLLEFDAKSKDLTYKKGIYILLILDK